MTECVDARNTDYPAGPHTARFLAFSEAERHENRLTTLIHVNVIPGAV